ncbi:MAG: hypothetical protein AAGH15_18255 [Myxococcota bacterium]
MSEAESGDDGARWVVVETHKGIREVFSYRGRAASADVEAWRRGELHGALRLEQCYWIEPDPDTGKLTPVVIGRTASEEFRMANGTLHLAADTIVVIMELRGPDPGVEGEAAPVYQLGSVRESKP